MPDPTDAEIQTGADAIARSWRVLSHSSRRHLAKLVLTEVLPDHDARVAEEIAQAIERDAEDSALGQYALGAAERCAAIARQRREETPPTCRHPVEPGSDICIRTFSDPPCPACPDFGEETQDRE